MSFLKRHLESLKETTRTDLSKLIPGLDLEKDCCIRVLVTPKIALALLEINIDNRRVNNQRVAMHKAKMERGEFKYTPDAIIISERKLLINGQHRLIALSQMPESYCVHMDIRTGVPHELFAVLDCGLPRTSRDVLESSGIRTYSSSIPAIVKKFYSIYGNKTHDNSRSRMNRLRANSNAELSSYEILDLVKNNTEYYTQIASLANSESSKLFFTTTLCGAILLHLCDAYGKEMAFMFMDLLISPEKYAQYPTLVKARDKLMRMRRSRSRASRSEKENQICKTTVDFFNKFYRYEGVVVDRSIVEKYSKSI